MSTEVKERVIWAVISAVGGIAHVVLYLFGWGFIGLAGKAVGNVLYALKPGRRKIISNELGLLLGSRIDRRRLRKAVRQSFENYYARHLETVFFGSLDEKTLEKIAHVEGIGHIDDALSRGNGVIMLLSHFGSFLLPLPYLGFKGYRVNQITGKQIHGSLLARKIWEWRSREASRLPVGFKQVDKFLRPVYKALKDNEIVAIAFDGRDSTHWAVVDFLERKGRFSTGPFELARRTGAAIVPTFIVRGKDNTQKIVFEPPFRLSGEADVSNALADDVQRFADIFSGYVSRYPCHFGMVLYKTRTMLEFNKENSLFADNK